MTKALRRAAPIPPAQIAPFVQVLGIDGAIRFILAYGGAELVISANPRDGNDLVEMFGRDAVQALAALTGMPRRIPLVKPWLAAYFHAEGLSIAQIARKLRVSDVAVRNYLRKDAENRKRLREAAERRGWKRGRTVLKVEINDAAIARAFKTLEMSIVNTGSVMAEIGENMLRSTQDRFRAGVTPEGTPFAPRSPVTLGRYKETRTKHRKTPLWRGGDLYRTINMQYDDEAAAIGSNAVQAAMMHFGGTRSEHPNLWGDIPVRPFLGLSEQDRSDVVEVVHEWLHESVMQSLEDMKSLY